MRITLGGTRLKVNPVGTLDHAPPPDQMRAIGEALGHYYQTPDWLEARKRERPGA